MAALQERIGHIAHLKDEFWAWRDAKQEVAALEQFVEAGGMGELLGRSGWCEMKLGQVVGSVCKLKQREGPVRVVGVLDETFEGYFGQNESWDVDIEWFSGYLASGLDALMRMRHERGGSADYERVYERFVHIADRFVGGRTDAFLSEHFPLLLRSWSDVGRSDEGAKALDLVRMASMVWDTESVQRERTLVGRGGPEELQLLLGDAGKVEMPLDKGTKVRVTKVLALVSGVGAERLTDGLRTVAELVGIDLNA